MKNYRLGCGCGKPKPTPPPIKLPTEIKTN